MTSLVSDKLHRMMSNRASSNPELERAFLEGEAYTRKAAIRPRNVFGGNWSPYIQRTKKRVPVSPDRAASCMRKRRWAGGSNLPPSVRDRFTEGERAVMAVVMNACGKRGQCDYPIDKIASLAGVGRTTAQNALRKARSGDRPVVSVEERPQPGRKNLTNIVRIVSRECWRWIQRAIGFKTVNPSKTMEQEADKAQRISGGVMAYEQGACGPVMPPKRPSMTPAWRRHPIIGETEPGYWRALMKG
jgi:hypothetical protein